MVHQSGADGSSIQHLQMVNWSEMALHLYVENVRENVRNELESRIVEFEKRIEE